MRYVFYINGDIIVDFYNGIFNVGEFLDKTQSAYDVLDPVNFYCSCADVYVACPHGGEYLIKADLKRAHRIGVHVYLVFPDKAADGCHLADALGA